MSFAGCSGCDSINMIGDWSFVWIGIAALSSTRKHVGDSPNGVGWLGSVNCKNGGSVNARLYDDGIDTKTGRVGLAPWVYALAPSVLLALLGSASLIGQRLRSR